MPKSTLVEYNVTMKIYDVISHFSTRIREIYGRLQIEFPLFTENSDNILGTKYDIYF